MSRINQWKVFGFLAVFIGVKSFFKSEVVWGYYGDNYGIFAKIAGVLMVVMGLSIIFSKNRK